jgi:hypothetical protein
LYKGIKSKQVEAGKRRKEKEMNLREKVILMLESGNLIHLV